MGNHDADFVRLRSGLGVVDQERALRDEAKTRSRNTRRTERIATALRRAVVRCRYLGFTTTRVDEPRILEVVPLRVRLVGFFLVYVFNAEQEVTAVEITTGDESKRVVCALRVEPVSRLHVELDAVEVLLRDDVDNTSYSVSTVYSGGAILQDFDAIDHRRRNRLVVATVYGTLAVNQRQRADGTETAKVNLYRTVTAVVGRRADRRTGHRRQALQKVTNVRNTRHQDVVLVDDGHGAGAIEVGALNARTSRDDFLDRFCSIGAGVLCHSTRCNRNSKSTRTHSERKSYCRLQITCS